MTIRRLATLAALAVSGGALSLLLASCDRSPVTPPAGPTGAVITATSTWPDTVLIGVTITLGARVTDGEGRPISSPALAWHTSAEERLQLIGSDALTRQAAAVGTGAARLTVTLDDPLLEGADLEHDLVVTLGGVVMNERSATLASLGDTLVIGAWGLGAGDQPARGSGLTWTLRGEAVDTTHVASGDSLRLVARAAGTDTVTVSHPHCRGACSLDFEVRVDPVPTAVVATIGGADSLSFGALGATDTLRAEVRDARGNLLEGTKATWSYAEGWTAADTAAVRLEGAVVTAGANHDRHVALVAAAGESRDTVHVTVRQLVHRVEVAPAALELHGPGGTDTVAAVVHDSLDHPLARPFEVSWSSRAPELAAVAPEADRPLRAAVSAEGDAGETWIVVEVEGVADSVAISISPRLQRVEVSPAADTLNAIGAERQLSAAALDAEGAELEGYAFSWSSSDTLVAVVDSTGRVIAVGTGDAQVVAASGAQADTARIHVRQVLASIELPESARMVEGDTLTLTATARDSAGSVIPGAAFAWSVSDSTVLLLPEETSGEQVEVVASDAGSAMVTATSGDISAAAEVTVEPRVASAEISPWRVGVGPGETTQLSATLRDGEGAVISSVHTAWSSSDPQVATVDSAGRVTAQGLGTVTITATSQGESATARVAVEPVVQVWEPAHEALVSVRLNGVWGASASDIFGVGDLGTIVHFDGSAWRTMESNAPLTGSGMPASLFGVWGTSASNVWAVGASGTILHFDGSAWREVETNLWEAWSAPWLRAVWGTSASNVFAVGPGGTVVRFNGTSWASMNTPTTEELRAVWGTATNNIYAVGGWGTIIRFNGSSWGTVNHFWDNHRLAGLWGTAANNIYAVGTNNILRFNGSNWTGSPGPPWLGQEYQTGIWGSAANDIITIGDQGVVWRWNGSTWVEENPPTPIAMRGIWGSGAGNVVVVGDEGHIRRYDGTTWTLEEHAGRLNAIWSAPGGAAAFAVGDHGTVYRSTGGGWERMESSAPPRWQGRLPHLRAVHGTAADAVFAVGDLGTALRFDGAAWQPTATGTNETLNGVWAAAADDVFAVGARGTILRDDGAGWMAMPNPLEGSWANLTAVWGSGPDDVYAGGSRGGYASGTVLLHYDGTEWREVFSPGGEWVALWGAGSDDVYVLGRGEWESTFGHFDGNEWHHLPAPVEVNLRALWGTSPTNLYAVGSRGRVHRWDGSAWHRMQSGTTAHLYGITGLADGRILMAADGGMIHAARP